MTIAVITQAAVLHSVAARLRDSAWLPLVLFKLQWLLLVPGRTRFLVHAAVLLIVQLALLIQRKGRRSLGLVVTFAATGIMLDQLLASTHIFQFDTAALPPSLLLLWPAFAATLPLVPILERLPTWQLAITGSLLGVAGYGAAFVLGVLDFGASSRVALAVLALCWAFLLPLQRWMRSVWIPLAPLVVLIAATFMPLRSMADDGWPVIGNATFRVLWSNIYDATLQSPATEFQFPGKPFVLTLQYHRSISANRIVDATLDQWRYQQIAWPAEWQQTLVAAIPAVAPGDTLQLQVDDAGKGTLSHNNARVADFDNTDFVTALASIWLGERTSHPAFRRQLLGDTP